MPFACFLFVHQFACACASQSFSTLVCVSIIASCLVAHLISLLPLEPDLNSFSPFTDKTLTKLINRFLCSCLDGSFLSLCLRFLQSQWTVLDEMWLPAELEHLLFISKETVQNFDVSAWTLTVLHVSDVLLHYQEINYYGSNPVWTESF